jgi:hypothetical protein
MTVESSSPVGDADTVDIVGVRKDGRLDLVLTASAALDASAATLSLLEAKLRNYLTAALSERFLRDYGRALGAPVTIYVSCAYPIADSARDLIRKLREEALQKGIELEVRAHMGEVQ